MVKIEIPVTPRNMLHVLWQMQLRKSLCKLLFVTVKAERCIRRRRQRNRSNYIRLKYNYTFGIYHQAVATNCIII